MGQGFAVHTATIIAHGKQHIRARDKTGFFITLVLLESDIRRLNGNLAHIADSVPGINAQIGQYLVHLAGVHLDRP